MSPYEEENKKNYDKHHGGKKVTEEPVTNENHNFGSVSKEIDDILGDISNSHDVKTNESYPANTENHNQIDREELIDKQAAEKTKEPSPLSQASFDEQKNDAPEETIDQDQEFTSDDKTNSNPFFNNDKKDWDQEDQTKTSIPAAKPNQDAPQNKPFFQNESQKTNQESQTETSIPKQETINETSTENQDSINTTTSEPVQQIQKSKDRNKPLFGKQKSAKDKNKAKLKIGLFSKNKNKTVKKKVKGPKNQKKSIGLFSKKKNANTKSNQQTPNLTTNQTIAYSNQEHHENAFHQPLEQQGGMDQDVLKLLVITDDLLGKLPEDVISEFASSEDFKLYKKVMDRYNIGK